VGIAGRWLQRDKRREHEFVWIFIPSVKPTRSAGLTKISVGGEYAYPPWSQGRINRVAEPKQGAIGGCVQDAESIGRCYGEE
jgi:hypothetical protein